MYEIREIMDGLFQIKESEYDRQKASYFVKRSFGNFLIYDTPLTKEVRELIESHGGVSKYFRSSVSDGDENGDAVFQRYGATSIFGQVDNPEKLRPYRWELFSDNHSLYQGLHLVGSESIQHLGMYLLDFSGKKLLFTNAALELHNGHWIFASSLDGFEKQSLHQQLQELSFHYLLPHSLFGYVSFQQVALDVKSIEIRHLASSL